MLPCHKKCAYKDLLPGNSHISCSFNWGKYSEKKVPKNQGSSRTNKWFLFPFNFDPTWGPDKCEGYNTELKLKDKKEINSLDYLISLMGKRLVE